MYRKSMDQIRIVGKSYFFIVVTTDTYSRYIEHSSIGVEGQKSNKPCLSALKRLAKQIIWQ